MQKLGNRIPFSLCALISAICIGASVFATYFYITEMMISQSTSDEILPNSQKQQQTTMSVENLWKAKDFYENRLPPNVKSDSEHVAVKSERVFVKEINAFYRTAKPPPSVQPLDQDVLLLHGAAFSSKTWLELNTINILAALGYNVIATDLPGYGETGPFNGVKLEYIEEFIKALNLNRPVIVSPSMSGSFSISYVEKHWKDIGGYVPVAPINTASLQKTASDIKVPTLIIYGEKDVGLGTGSAKDLELIETSQTVVLPGARHPAYLDQPQKFHTLLFNFIEAVRKTK